MQNIYLFSTSSYKNVTHINSLEVQFIQQHIDFSQYDYLISTSKQISYFFKKFHIKPILPALAISQKTAESYENIGGTILDIGNGYGDNLFTIISKYPKSKRWLYLRAKIVASNFVEKAKAKGYNITEIIIYNTTCSQDILQSKIESNAILIFTSPSSVECFLQNHTFLPTHQVIVIGTTTAKKIPQDISYKISPKTTIKSCIETII